MDANQPNPVFDIPLGRAVEEVKIVNLPSGRQALLVERKASIDDGGVWRTHMESFLVPPLNCGHQPVDELDIRECTLCLAIVCRAHSFDCPVCGLSCCSACRTQIEVNCQAVQLCVRCAEAAQSSVLAKLMARLFKL